MSSVEFNTLTAGNLPSKAGYLETPFSKAWTNCSPIKILLFKFQFNLLSEQKWRDKERTLKKQKQIIVNDTKIEILGKMSLTKRDIFKRCTIKRSTTKRYIIKRRQELSDQLPDPS